MLFIANVCVSLVFITIAAGLPSSHSDDTQREQETGPAVNQESLRLVTILMRHGDRSPIDTYPYDPHYNSTMTPYGWGQLTNKGRMNAYNLGSYIRNRYDNLLGSDYHPDKFWLQSTSYDRTKMTGMIVSAALWKPNEEQTFKVGLEWQPVILNHWPKQEDRLLGIWKACPKLTLERINADTDSRVVAMNRKLRELYEHLAIHSGWPMNSIRDVANLYATLKAEEGRGIAIPDWIKPYYREELQSIATKDLFMYSYTDKLKRLRIGPFIKKMINKMLDKSKSKLEPKSRKMYTYIAHDDTLVSLLSTLNVWDGKEPDFTAVIMIELHESNGNWSVNIFEKNLPDYKTRQLKIPECNMNCPLNHFVGLLEPYIPADYDEECKVDDPSYVVPDTPPA